MAASLSQKLIFTVLILAIAIPISYGHRRIRGRRSERSYSDDNEQYLRDICSETKRSDVCLNILKSESHMLDSDERGVAAGVIDLAIAKSEQIGDQLNQWYEDTNDDKMRDKYHSCAENYYEANRYLEDAQSNLNSDDYQRISDQMDDAEEELDQCRREFQDSPDPGHVGDRNNELEIYLDMVRAATGHVGYYYEYRD